MRRWGLSRGLKALGNVSRWTTAILAMSLILHPCAASSLHHRLTARLLIDDARAFTGGDEVIVTSLPPHSLPASISIPAVAPSEQIDEDGGPLGDYGLSYMGSTGAQRRPSPAMAPRQSAVPAPAPAQPCQSGVGLIGGPSVSVSMAPGPRMGAVGQPVRAPVAAPAAQPVQLKSPSKALPPGVFQKAVPAPKENLAFKSN